MDSKPKKQDIGIKLSIPGVDVDKAGQYIFNSSWPTISIAFEKTIVVPPGGRATVPHGLGFIPFVRSWLIDGAISRGDIITPEVDSENIYVYNDQIFNPLNTQTTGSTIHIKAYFVDISQERNFTYVNSPTLQAPYDPNFGIKIVKEGRDINSQDLRDFILHSRAQSPQILSIVTTPKEVTGSAYAQSAIVGYSNPNQYIPWVFGYWSADGSKYQAVPLGGQAVPVLFVYANYVFVIGSPTDFKQSLIVLRDPFLAPKETSVVYDG